LLSEKRTLNDNQIDLLKMKLKDYIHFDDNLNFNQIIQLIVTQLEQQSELNQKMQEGK
jgi:hypothetical protein